MREFRGLAFLVWLTLQRQATGRKAVVAGVLLAMLSLVAVLWARRNGLELGASEVDRNKALQRYTSQLVLPVYVSFLLPILAMIYATGAIADEREERTLVHLLIRPLARFRIYLAKGLGILPLVMLVGVGGYAAVCLCAGSTGRLALQLYWPAIVLGALGYSSLFLLFGGLLPRPVILAVVYAFFVESLLGNTPGTIKRIAVSFHVQCMIYSEGHSFGVKAPAELQFGPISGRSATWVLGIAALGLLAMGAWMFQTKEFRDLE